MAAWLHLPHLRRDAEWAFVHIQEGSNAVACAVPVVQAVLPQRSPRKGIKCLACGAGGEPGACEADVPLQHARVAALLMRRRRAEVQRARDVCSSEDVEQRLGGERV